MKERKGLEIPQYLIDQAPAVLEDLKIYVNRKVYKTGQFDDDDTQ